MANIYVRSTDGDDASDGLSWANAKATLGGAAGAASIDAAGDTIFLSQAHAESGTANSTIALAGTPAAPTRIICGNDGAEPPTALAATATVTVTSSAVITISGNGYVLGVAFSNGTAANSTSLILASSAASVRQKFDTCDLINGSTGSTSGIVIGITSSAIEYSLVEWENCRLKLGGTNNRIRIGNVKFEWRGGSVISGTSTPANSLFASNSAGRAGTVKVDGVDLSNFGTTLIFFDVASNLLYGEIANCKLPSGWPTGAGGLVAGTATAAARYAMYNCDAGDLNYKLWIEDVAGSVRDEAVIVRTGGATDGDTPISHKLATNANALFPLFSLRSEPLIRRQSTVGSAVTVTVEIVHDTNVAAGQGAGASFAFQDDEVWLEVRCLDTNGVPLGGFLTDAKGATATFKFGDVLAAAADQASSSVAWTTTGLTTPVKQKLSVTVTPREKGFIQAVVCCAKASKTLYYCSKIDIT